MIKEDITKLFFIDIETVGIEEDLDSLHSEYPHLFKVWESTGVDYFKRRYPEDSNLSSNQLFTKRAALIPEFGKIVCVSVGFLMADGEIKLDTFMGNEKDILQKTSSLFDRVDNLNFNICGHNIKNFDLPYIAKRMLINNIKVPNIIPNYKIKPWESKVLDTKEVWNFNSFKGLSSLELICATMGIDNPKDNEVNGSNMHNYYYNNSDKDKIKNYCEEDVKSTIKLIQKIKTL
mgnify:FL=1